jgi:hypothetical protein
VGVLTWWLTRSLVAELVLRPGAVVLFLGQSLDARTIVLEARGAWASVPLIHLSAHATDGFTVAGFIITAPEVEARGELTLSSEGADVTVPLSAVLDLRTVQWRLRYSYSRPARDDGVDLTTPLTYAVDLQVDSVRYRGQPAYDHIYSPLGRLGALWASGALERTFADGRVDTLSVHEDLHWLDAQMPDTLVIIPTSTTLSEVPFENRLAVRVATGPLRYVGGKYCHTPRFWPTYTPAEFDEAPPR